MRCGAWFTSGLNEACGQMKIYTCLIGRGWVARDNQRLRGRTRARKRKRAMVIHNTLVAKGGAFDLAATIFSSPISSPSSFVTHRAFLMHKEPVKAGCCGTWAIKSSYTVSRRTAAVEGLLPRLYKCRKLQQILNKNSKNKDWLRNVLPEWQTTITLFICWFIKNSILNL